MPRFSEDLGGGLWTSPDPAFLQPGQLSGLQNGVYKPGSLALQRALGRTGFGSASGSTVDVVGLRDIQFDNGNQYLIAVASASALTAAVGDTGTFGQLATFTSPPTQLEVAHYRNRFYGFSGLSIADTVTGVNTNLVVYMTATGVSNTPLTRQHGMVAVNAPPVTATTATAFSQTVTGYYEYWTTEVATSTQDGAPFRMESTFTGAPVTYLASTTALAPIITRPDVYNNAAATHWRVYRSPVKDKESDKKFPSGFLISSDISIAATSMIDSATVTSTGFVLPSLFNGVSPDATTIYSDMAGATALSAVGGAVSGTYTSTGPTNTKAQGCYGYNFGGFTGPVQGITVEIKASVTTSNNAVKVQLTRGRRTDGSYIPSGLGSRFQDFYDLIHTGQKTFHATTTPTVYTLGSSTDNWLAKDSQLPWVDSEFTSSNFMVVISFASPAGSKVLSVDYVQVKAFYGGSIESTVVFPTVIYNYGDISAQVGKNGPPPSSTTGDVFEDQLVVNDVANSSLVRWSAPQDPDSFPSTYYDDIETRENDQVRVIKVVNSQLVVLMDSAVWRYNYLPSELDSSFDRGKARTPISRTYGAYNAMCACTFSAPGMPEQLAFVGDSGFHTTDGFNIVTHSIGLNWRNVISSTSTSNPICLVNDRENREVLFYYRNDANGNETYLCLHFSYSSEHMTNGMMKVSGPVNMRNYNSTGPNRGDLKSAWSVQRSTGATNIYLGYGGTGVSATAAGAGAVYRETGTAIPAQDATLGYITRRMYQAGFANEWKVDEVYGYAGSYDGAPTVSYALLTTKTDDTGETTQASKSIVLGGQKVHHLNFAQMGEGIRVSAIITASAYAQESLTIEGAGWGMQDSGR